MGVSMNPLEWIGLKKSEEDKVRIELRKLEFQLNRAHEDELQKRDKTIYNLENTISLRGTEIAQARSTYERDIQRNYVRAEKEKQDIIVAYVQEIDHLRSTHANEILHLNRIHEQSSASLQTEVEQLNDALLTRDDEIYQGMIFTASGLPQMPDNHIRDNFLQVQQMVEELMRQPWKHDQQVWPQQLVQKLSTRHSETLVRKIIIQDLIWSVLFQRVFCSPFRVFGDAGKKLEQDWHESSSEVEDCPDGVYAWPVPGVKTERWRIMTLKECQAALREPLSQYDPRAAVKDGYKASLSKLTEELKKVLGSLIQVEASDVQIIQQLSRKAVRMWLDFGLHRCRIRIYPATLTPRTMEAMLSIAQQASLVLTAVPMVGRYGNVKGVQLEDFTKIDGCAGDSITVP